MGIDLDQDESSSSCESESGYMTLTFPFSLQGVLRRQSGGRKSPGANEAKPDSLLHYLMFFFFPFYYPNAMAVYCFTKRAFVVMRPAAPLYHLSEGRTDLECALSVFLSYSFLSELSSLRESAMYLV